MVTFRQACKLLNGEPVPELTSHRKRQRKPTSKLIATATAEPTKAKPAKAKPAKAKPAKAKPAKAKPAKTRIEAVLAALPHPDPSSSAAQIERKSVAFFIAKHHSKAK